MTERRQITPEQAAQLERLLQEMGGEPKTDEITVDEHGTITTHETWGDEITTTTRRKMLGDNIGGP